MYVKNLFTDFFKEQNHTINLIQWSLKAPLKLALINKQERHVHTEQSNQIEF